MKISDQLKTARDSSAVADIQNDGQIHEVPPTVKGCVFFLIFNYLMCIMGFAAKVNFIIYKG